MQLLQRTPQLPPLILHPFSGGNGVDDLLEGSRASLALQGLLESSEEESVLHRRMLIGRYQEVRMLIFLGKDIFRWLQQCVETVSPPEAVRRKLESWGVTDRRAVFSRAIGLHSLFQDPPAPETLSPIFLKNYHRFADHAYICFQHLESFLPLDARRFEFEIYASEEYARILSDQWEQDADN
jgi:hypothetical protein